MVFVVNWLAPGGWCSAESAGTSMSLGSLVVIRAPPRGLLTVSSPAMAYSGMSPGSSGRLVIWLPYWVMPARAV